MSVVALQATLCGQHETLTENHRITLEGGVYFDLEVSFKASSLSRMLLLDPGPETSDFVKRVHGTVSKAWIHPNDGPVMLEYFREQAMAAAPQLHKPVASRCASPATL